MGYTKSMHGVATGFHLHMLFGLMLGVGVIMFLMWAYKNLSKDALKKWAIGLIVVGALGTVLTGCWGFKGWSHMKGYDNFDEDDKEEVLVEMEEHMDEMMDLE